MEASPLFGADQKFARKLDALRERVNDFGEERPLRGIVLDEDSPSAWAELDSELVALDEHVLDSDDQDRPA